MNLKPIGSNQNEVTLNDGTVVFFSYRTPVAACLGNGGGFIRTAKTWSITTSRHVTKWLDGAKAREVPQAELDALTA